MAQEWDDDEHEARPRRRPRPSHDIEATDLLIPTNVSGWSIAACYFGLIGFCLPFVGLVFAVPAFVFGLIALKKRKKHTSYGSVTSDIRAVVGLVLSGLSILVWGGLAVVMAVSGK